MYRQKTEEDGKDSRDGHGLFESVLIFCWRKPCATSFSIRSWNPAGIHTAYLQNILVNVERYRYTNLPHSGLNWDRYENSIQ
jgi:hypothetical protein